MQFSRFFQLNAQRFTLAALSIATCQHSRQFTAKQPTLNRIRYFSLRMNCWKTVFNRSMFNKL